MLSKQHSVLWASATKSTGYQHFAPRHTMKTNLILHVGSIFSLSTLSLIAGAAAPASHNDIQHPLTKNQTITMVGAKSFEQGVPGHNDAFYGPVPKAEQIFDIEFLEIAPSPIPV